MRKLPAIAAIAAVALAGTAYAGGARTHVMDIPLADGSVVHVEYVGEVAPKVTVAPAQSARAEMPWGAIALPSFAGFDRMIEQMNRQTQAMIQQAQRMAQQPAAAAGTPYVASFGSIPAGTTSYSVTSVSNGGASCTRTTEVVSQGDGKPPKVTTNVSGNCGKADAPAASTGPVNRT